MCRTATRAPRFAGRAALVLTLRECSAVLDSQVYDSVTDGLKQLYKQKIKPVEEVRNAAWI